MKISPLSQVLILESVITLASWTFFVGTLIDRDGYLPILLALVWATAWLFSTILIILVGFPDKPKLAEGEPFN